MSAISAPEKKSRANALLKFRKTLSTRVACLIYATAPMGGIALLALGDPPKTWTAFPTGQAKAFCRRIAVPFVIDLPRLVTSPGG